MEIFWAISTHVNTERDVIIIPHERIHPLDMTVDQALKYIISMGVAAPPNGLYSAGSSGVLTPVVPDNRN